MGAGRLRKDFLKRWWGGASCNQCGKTQVQGKQGANPGSGWGRAEARLIWSVLLIWEALNPLDHVSATVEAWLRAFPTGQGLPGTALSSMWEELLGGETCSEFWKRWRTNFSVENYEKEAWEVGCYRESIIWVLWLQCAKASPVSRDLGRCVSTSFNIKSVCCISEIITVKKISGNSLCCILNLSFHVNHFVSELICVIGRDPVGYCIVRSKFTFLENGL